MVKLRKLAIDFQQLEDWALLREKLLLVLDSRLAQGAMIEGVEGRWLGRHLVVVREKSIEAAESDSLWLLLSA